MENTQNYTDRSFHEWLNAEIADAQAQLDDIDMFGGDPQEEQRLKNYLAELREERHRPDEDRADRIVLETGETLKRSDEGGWGRLHYVSYAIGSRKPQRDFWICTHCGKQIQKGQEHYRRSYYEDKSDKHSGHQLRLCMNCFETHEHANPPNTTFPVYRSPRQKAA